MFFPHQIRSKHDSLRKVRIVKDIINNLRHPGSRPLHFAEFCVNALMAESNEEEVKITSAKEALMPIASVLALVQLVLHPEPR